MTALLALNRQFYARFAGDFARTRRSWPPGFDRIVPYLESGFNVLDLGCGNARLLAFLDETGWTGRYAGLDSSEELLDEARRVAEAHPSIPATFILGELFGGDWPAVAQAAGQFDALVSLAVLHHIPGRASRVAFLAQCAELISEAAPLIVSSWQFMSSARLRRRLVRWEVAGIQEQDVEDNDYLVGWGEGSPGVRYCAFIDEGSLKEMAAEAGLSTTETFYSDGHEGNLNLYGVFKRADC